MEQSALWNLKFQNFIYIKWNCQIGGFFNIFEVFSSLIHFNGQRLVQPIFALLSSSHFNFNFMSWIVWANRDDDDKLYVLAEYVLSAFRTGYYVSNSDLLRV